jgi:hypothetical protein
MKNQQNQAHEKANDVLDVLIGGSDSANKSYSNKKQEKNLFGAFSQFANFLTAKQIREVVLRMGLGPRRKIVSYTLALVNQDTRQQFFTSIHNRFRIIKQRKVNGLFSSL